LKCGLVFQVRSHLPVNFVSVNEADMSKASTLHIPAAQALTLMPAATGERDASAVTLLSPPPLELGAVTVLNS